MYHLGHGIRFSVTKALNIKQSFIMQIIAGARNVFLASVTIFLSDVDVIGATPLLTTRNTRDIRLYYQVIESTAEICHTLQI